MKWKINSLGDNAVKEDISSRKYLATSSFLPFSHFSGSFVPSTLDSAWKLGWEKWQSDFSISPGEEMGKIEIDVWVNTYIMSADMFICRCFDTKRL